MIKNIIFDIGNVLVDFRWKAHLSDKGLTQDEVKYIGDYTVKAPIWNQMDLGERKEEDIIADMKACIPDKVLGERFMLLFEDMHRLVEPYPGNREWLSGLKERGYKIYLLSNYPHDMFLNHAENSFDFMDLIDGKVVSSFVKKLKPNADIYQCLLETYGLKAEECVFLDDKKENTDGAEAVGIRAINVLNRQQAISELEAALADK